MARQMTFQFDIAVPDNADTEEVQNCMQTLIAAGAQGWVNDLTKYIEAYMTGTKEQSDIVPELVELKAIYQAICASALGLVDEDELARAMEKEPAVN